MGIGDWGLGIGGWGLGPIPNPQTPIPKPPTPVFCNYKNIIKFEIKYSIYNLFYKFILFT